MRLVVGSVIAILSAGAATMASAECGWLRVPADNDRGTSGWVVVGGFRTYQECEQASDRMRAIAGREGAVLGPGICTCRAEVRPGSVREGPMTRDIERPKPSVREPRNAP